MPEVPQEQAPSREEQLLSSEANTEIEVQQQGVPTPHALPTPNEAQQPLGAVKESEVSEYQEGQIYTFVDPQGQGYSIVIQKVADDKLTILNQTAPGAEPAEISVEDAKNMFQAGKLVQ